MMLISFLEKQNNNKKTIVKCYKHTTLNKVTKVVFLFECQFHTSLIGKKLALTYLHSCKKMFMNDHESIYNFNAFNAH